MPSGQLHQYRFIEDAWSGGLRVWCEAARDSDREESWILAENAGQTRWLLRRLAQAEIAGVRIFDAEGLREELARRAGLAPLPCQAVAAFAVKVAAAREEGEAAVAAARNAGALAEACDALARAGWHLNQLGVDTSIARRLHRTLDRTAALAGIFDRRLREALPARALRLCCVGWDAARWPDLGLLDLAAAKARSCDLYVPSPRLPADALQREWIEALEERLALERRDCPESGFVSENEALVARLENSQLAYRAEARAPLLLAGREWGDQVRLVCEQVLAWLARAPGAEGAIGIIGPEDSATAIAVAEALENAGVCVEHPGRRREPPPALLILEQVAQYHLNGHDIGELIELARLLWLYQREQWGMLDPEAVRDALDRAFQAAQSRNARIVAQALPWRKDAAWTAVCKLVEALGRWDGEDQSWPDLLDKWDRLLSALRLAPGSAEAAEGKGAGRRAGEPNLPHGIPLLPAPPPGLFKDERVPARAFMEWLADHLSAQRRDPPPPDYSALAPVVVTTFAGAVRQTWERLIFLDSNEHVWPAPIPENPFLPDLARTGLNRNRRESARLLTTRDLRALEQARFLDLLEHCRGSIAFAGVLLEQTDAGDRVQPNEWVLRALLETADEETFPPDLWEAAARTCPASRAPALEADERAHLEHVHASRHNATMPPDRYQFDFHETRIEPGAWSPTDLDDAVIIPATFALRALFGAESTAGWNPLRAEGAAVGNRAHRWLGRILEAGGAAREDEAALGREVAAARRELAEWYGAEDLAMPTWWETCLRKTEWAARRCLREVRREAGEGGHCATEQTLAVTVRTPAGPLVLKGRIDILLSDRPELPGARVRIFDFKTGRSAAPTLASLERGYGGQFAAYYLMARDAGAAEAVIGIIKPEERARVVFAAADEEALRARFAGLAALQANLRFGRLGPLVADYGVCETLPLATTPIDPAILEQKAAHFLIAS